MPITIGKVMKGPMPTISIMLIAVACARPNLRSNEAFSMYSYSDAYIFKNAKLHHHFQNRPNYILLHFSLIKKFCLNSCNYFSAQIFLMKKILLFVFVAVFVNISSAQQIISLYNGAVPNSKPTNKKEQVDVSAD